MNQIFWQILPWSPAIRIPILLYFGLYNSLIRHFSLYEIKRIIYAVTSGSLVLVSLCFLAGKIFGYSRGIFLIDWCFLTIFLIGSRIILKKVHQWYLNRHIAPEEKRQVLIWGAGDYGELCLQYLKNGQAATYNVVGFIDNDLKNQGKKIGGVKILGDGHHLPLLVELYKIDDLFLAFANLIASEVKEIARIAIELNLKLKVFSPNQESFPEGIAEVSPPGTCADTHPPTASYPQSQ